MNDLRTAAQQALEFCEFLWREVVLNDWAERQREATEAALRAALAEPVQEPVATNIGCLGMPVNTPVTPPQRLPLTEEELDELSRTMVKGDRSVNWLCRAIERAHGIT